jgi:hypothetical protein
MKKWCWKDEGIISFPSKLLKVTIIMGYWFQTSSKKEGIDPYNPDYKINKAVLF